MEKKRAAVSSLAAISKRPKPLDTRKEVYDVRSPYVLLSALPLDMRAEIARHAGVAALGAFIRTARDSGAVFPPEILYRRVVLRDERNARLFFQRTLYERERGLYERSIGTLCDFSSTGDVPAMSFAGTRAPDDVPRILRVQRFFSLCVCNWMLDLFVDGCGIRDALRDSLQELVVTNPGFTGLHLLGNAPNLQRLHFYLDAKTARSLLSAVHMPALQYLTVATHKSELIDGAFNQGLVHELNAAIERAAPNSHVRYYLWPGGPPRRPEKKTGVRAWCAAMLVGAAQYIAKQPAHVTCLIVAGMSAYLYHVSLKTAAATKMLRENVPGLDRAVAAITRAAETLPWACFAFGPQYQEESTVSDEMTTKILARRPSLANYATIDPLRAADYSLFLPGKSEYIHRVFVASDKPRAMAGDAERDALRHIVSLFRSAEIGLHTRLRVVDRAFPSLYSAERDFAMGQAVRNRRYLGAEERALITGKSSASRRVDEPYQFCGFLQDSEETAYYCDAFQPADWLSGYAPALTRVFFCAIVNAGRPGLISLPDGLSNGTAPGDECTYPADYAASLLRTLDTEARIPQLMRLLPELARQAWRWLFVCIEHAGLNSIYVMLMLLYKSETYPDLACLTLEGPVPQPRPGPLQPSDICDPDLDYNKAICMLYAEHGGAATEVLDRLLALVTPLESRATHRRQTLRTIAHIRALKRWIELDPSSDDGAMWLNHSIRGPPAV